jgi:hypothetical protein
MKTILIPPAACLILLCACAAPNRLQDGPGATHVGAPETPFDARVLGGVPSAARAAIRLPDRITLPASYRLVLLDGHLTLIRETDAAALEEPASIRIVSGETARGELAYQPALLPQELAAEAAANRESSARMNRALETVMQRSRELSEQALELQAQSQKLAELLSAEQARVRELEAEGRAAPEKDASAKSDPDAPHS